jgi:DNA-binding SARP family transcriptional activator
MAAGFHLHLLGSPALLRVGAASSATGDISASTPSVSPDRVLGSGKPLAVLAFLHCAPGRSASREQLLELLWSDVSPEAGRHTLRQTLWYLKRKLGTEVVVSGFNNETLQLSLPIRSDWQDFLEAAESGSAEETVKAYRGDFIPDFASPGGAAFEQWADIERARLQTLFVGAATRLVHERLAAGRARDAAQQARAARTMVPASQPCARLLLEALLAAGDAAGAKAELQRLLSQLAADELDADAATLALERTINRALDGSRIAPEQDAAEAGAGAASLFTELVGRESAFGALTQAFDRARRGMAAHVHISAPAGFGKTRLLDGLASRLHAQRARVVAVRATPAERTLPFALAGHLVGALVSLRGAAAVAPDSASALVAMLPAASAYLRADPDRSAGEEALRRRTLAVVDLIQAVSGDSALAVLLDDVHWMDPASRTIVASLAERASACRLLLATSARASDRWAELTPNATLVSLAPLTVEALHELLSNVARLPTAPWADLLPARLQTATGGSPLLAVETLQLALERQLLSVSDGEWKCVEPAALINMLGAGQAMQQRIAALPAIAAEALLAMACVGEPVREEAIAKMVGSDVRDALGVLEARGLAMRVRDDWQPAHDEIAAQVVDLASPRQREVTHRAIADWLEGQPHGPSSAQLSRATWHRWRASDFSGMARSFTRLVQMTREGGLATPAVVLARDSLGVDAPTDAVDDLVRLLPRRMGFRSSQLLGIAAAIALMIVVSWMWLRPSTTVPEAVGISLVTRVRDVTGKTRWVRGYFDPNRLAPDMPPSLMPIEPPLSDAVLESVGAVTGDLGGRLFGDRFRGDAPDRAIDLVELGVDGQLKPVESKPHDQFMPVLSPDRTQLAYLDRDFSETQAPELMLRDLNTGRSSRLTHTEAGELAPVWSPEGEEIAFVRTFGDTTPYEICRLRWRKSQESCQVTSAQFVPTAVRGWRSDGVSRASGLVVLVSWRDQQHMRILDEGGRTYFSAPSGEMLICQCQIPGIDKPILAAFSVDKPERKVPIAVDGEYLDAFVPSITIWGRERNVVRRAEIAGPDSMMIGETARLRVRAYNGEGRTVPMPYRRWISDSPRIATVDSSGVVSSRAAGMARIILESADGLRDTALLRVVDQRATTVLDERWTTPLESRWHLTGIPRSSITGPPNSRRLSINGDEVLTSGVISKAARMPTRGLGVSVRYRMAITASVWQSLAVSLDPMASDGEIETWQRSPGSPTPSSWTWRADRTCLLRLPQQEGGAFRDLVSLAGAGEIVARTHSLPPFGDGGVHEISIQLFTDGRCAFAIDGVMLGRSERPLRMDRPLRVVIEGQSVGTTAEVLSVNFWEGVKADGTFRGPSS